jgi:hypothetical protein
MRWWSKRVSINPPQPYSLVPIQNGPFEGDADRNAALGAALLRATFEVTGQWPPIGAVLRSVRELTDQGTR